MDCRRVHSGCVGFIRAAGTDGPLCSGGISVFCNSGNRHYRQHVVGSQKKPNQIFFG